MGSRVPESERVLKAGVKEDAKDKPLCPKYEVCPIVRRFLERGESLESYSDQPIEICGDDIRFYDWQVLFDENMLSYCSKLKDLKKRLENIRITWESPVFGPSGYAFAARGYITGLADLGVRISVKPIWGDCKITFEDEVKKNA